jgi:hypothetical protein
MNSLTALTAGGGVGGFRYMVAQRFLPFSMTNANMWAALVGFIVYFVLALYGRKSKAKWVAQFGMTISMIAGMLAGTIFLA